MNSDQTALLGVSAVVVQQNNLLLCRHRLVSKELQRASVSRAKEATCVKLAGGARSTTLRRMAARLRNEATGFVFLALFVGPLTAFDLDGVWFVRSTYL